MLRLVQSRHWSVEDAAFRLVHNSVRTSGPRLKQTFSDSSCHSHDRVASRCLVLEIVVSKISVSQKVASAFASG